MKFEIRKIINEDNLRVKEVLVSVMKEFDVPESGTALSDPELNDMFGSYKNNKSIYLVVVVDKEIFGGAGISMLNGQKKNICELQKMYFLPKIRNYGIGKILIEKCIEFAKNAGYEFCYIETMHNMKAAQNLYKKYNFKKIHEPLGMTGHTSCPVWMLKKL